MPVAKLSLQAASFTVGFVKTSSTNGVEDASSAGSGTLVSIGDVKGILTAAHVLDALPNSGLVGIVEHLNIPARYRKITISMEYSQKLKIRDGEFGKDRKDLGFLRLTDADIANLSASNVFYNLEKRRTEILSEKKLRLYFVDALGGIVEELTRDAENTSPGTRIKHFSAIFSIGKVFNKRGEDYDFYDFEFTPAPDFDFPSNYQGVSGGAIWRFCFIEQNKKIEIKKIWLYGVPFFQSKSGEQTIITCHGPKSIYDKLITKVKENWPQSPS